MLHEDRILKSIDLLTYNARETLLKYSIWATTKDSDVTFNLYDALPSYTNNGGTGSAVFQKPIKIPSFNSMATGIFGSVGTTSSRDIFWNFNFSANGDGWVFDQYVQTNNGMPVASGKTPVFQVKTDASFGVPGTSKKVNFLNSIINYISPDSEVIIDNSSYLIKTPIFRVSGSTPTSGFAEITSNIISIGDSYLSPTNIPSATIKILGQNVVLTAAVASTLAQYNVLNSANGITVVGDLTSNVILQSQSSAIKYSQLGIFDISAVGADGLDKINLLKSINSGLNIIDVFAFQSLGASIINNLFIGGHSSTTVSLGRLASVTREGFQFFSKSKLNNSTDTSNINEYFDAWVDAGLDGSSSASARETSQYSSVLAGFTDPTLMTSKPNPYYFNLGTKGTLNIFGGDSANISSNSTIKFLINNSPEIVVEKGSVTIPNLNLPKYSAFSLSTLRKSSYLRFNPQVKVFPFSQTKTLDNGLMATGMEVSIDISNERSVAEEDGLYIWSTFTHTETGEDYYYSFYLVDDVNNALKLMCTRYLGDGTSAPIYTSSFETSTVITGLPKLEVNGTKFNHNRIKVVSSRKAIYVIYATGTDNLTLSLYALKNLTGTSWIKLDPEYYSDNSMMKMDACAITANDVACACGNKDKVWISLELSSEPGYYSPTVLCYNETLESIVSLDLPAIYDFSLDVTTSDTSYVRRPLYKVLTFVQEYVLPKEQSRGDQIFLPLISIPSTSSYDAYRYENAGHVKISAIFNSANKFDAYVTMVLSAGIYQRKIIRIYKINFDTVNNILTLVGTKGTPGTTNGGVTSVYVPNELVLSETSPNNFALHSLLSLYYTDGTLYSEQAGRLGTFGPEYRWTWNETSGFTSATAGSSGTATAEIANFRYAIDQVCGWSSDTEYKVRTLATIDNSPQFNGYIYEANSTTMIDTFVFTIVNMSTVGNGLVIPFWDKDVLVERGTNIQYLYSREPGASLNFNLMQSKSDNIVKAINYVDGYSKYFKSSFIDAFGTNVIGYETHSSIFSNTKSGKYSYGIGNYDGSTIPGNPAIITNYDNGNVDNLVLIGNNTTVNNFKTIILTKSTSVINDGVNITLNKDGIEISDTNAVRVPVSIFGKSPIVDEASAESGMFRNGLFKKMSRLGDLGIAFNPFGYGFSGRYGQTSGYVPVELASILAKRYSQNNFDKIVRSDFSIEPIDNIPGLVAYTVNLKFAKISWESDINSGHDFPWMFDSKLKNESVTNDKVLQDSRNAYLVQNVGTVPENISFIRTVYAVYDSVFNRTHIIVVPTNPTLYSFKITSTAIITSGSMIIVSFDNEIINPFDANFDATMSITNSANNVVSIRVDGHNTLLTRTLGVPTLSSLILGYTETNFVESSC